MDAPASSRTRHAYVALACTGFAALAAGLLAWPMVPHDTDLWYHLNFGRRIVATFAIPSSAWYSFVPSHDDFVDYFWLSQCLFYALHRACGALGLIALRAALFLALTAAVFALVARSPLFRAGRARGAALAVLALLIALERFAMPRPHMFSYALLATLLLLIERGGSATYAVAPLAVLWANLHGIEYPVLWLVLGAALAQHLLAGGAHAAKREAVALGAGVLAVIATPFGLRLLPVPFTPLGLVGSEIFELRPLSFSALASFDVAELVPGFAALRVAIAALAAVAVASSLARRTIALRHLLWCAGGAVLLLRAERFAIEFALLALPAITHATWLGELRLPGSRRVASALVIAALVAVASARFAKVTRGPWPYPVASSVLPQGTAALLARNAGAGRVLSHPNYGGYLEWTLGDRMSIAADLQTPFLFDGTRVLELTAAYADGTALRAAAERWKADYVMVHWRDVQSLAPALGDAYALIGFDDVALLYAHRQRAAALVARAELHALTPQALQAVLARELPRAQLSAVAAELERLSALGAESAVVHAARAVVAAQLGARAAALAHAVAAVTMAPHQAEILRVAGEVVLDGGDAERALGYFTRGLSLAAEHSAPPPTRSALARGTAFALNKLGRAGEAYALLRPAFRELTSAAVSAGDLRLLAAAAADAGDAPAARTLERLAALRSGHPQ